VQPRDGGAWCTGREPDGALSRDPAGAWCKGGGARTMEPDGGAEQGARRRMVQGRRRAVLGRRRAVLERRRARSMEPGGGGACRQ
jgi:hypothetical protein